MKRSISVIACGLAMGFVLAPPVNSLVRESVSAYIHDGVIIAGGTVVGIVAALSNLFA